MIYFSQSLVLSGFLDAPANHARIGWHSIVNYFNVSGTDGLSGYPLTSISNPATYDEYRPVSSPASVVIDAGSAQACDYFAVQHKGISSATVEYSSDGVSYTQIDSVAVFGSAFMFQFLSTSARYWRLTFTGSNMAIKAFKLGRVLEMQRSIYSGHTPITLAPKHAVRNNLSESGQFLGASVKRTGYATSYEWNNLSPIWYRDKFDAFVKSIPRANPFFIAWNPLKYPLEVAYCWATGDISPTNTGRPDKMSVSLSVEGFADASE